jgi:hypothetical protein
MFDDVFYQLRYPLEAINVVLEDLLLPRVEDSRVMYCSGGYTLVKLPRIITPYRDSVDGTRDHVTY